jgi:signal transduction histidine kinase
MTRRFTLCLLIVCNFSIVFSQKHEIDSLKQKLAFSKEDSNKVMVLSALAKLYRFSNTDTAIVIATQGITLAEKIKYPRGKAGCLNQLGICFYNKGDYSKALECHTNALTIRQQLKDKRLIAGSMNNLGNVYKEQGRLDKALECYKQTLQIDEAQNDKHEIPYSLCNLATIYSEQGNYTLALESFLKSITFFSQNKDKEGLGFANNNIGIVYQRIQDESSALKYYEQAVKNFRETNYPRGESEALTNIGTIYESRKDYQKSLFYYQEALSISQKNNEKYSIAQIKGNLGVNLTELGGYEQAEQVLMEAISLSTEIESLPLQAINYYQLATLFERQKNTNQALIYAKKSEEISLKIGKKEELPRIFELLARLYAQKQDFSNAYQYFSLAKEKQDSLTGIEKQKIIANVEAKYQIGQRQTKIDLLEKEKKLQERELESAIWEKSFYAVLSISLVILVMVLMRYNRKKTINNRLLQMQNEEIKTQKEEIMIQKEELHAQAEMLTDLNQTKEKLFSIIAHDLRSPLNNLRGLMELSLINPEILSNNKYILEKLQKDLENNYLLLDNLLNWSLSQMNGMQMKQVSFAILHVVREKITLFKSIYEAKNIQVENHISPDIEVFADENQVQIIFRNLLSNAIKFTPTNGKIVVKAEKREKSVQVSVKDTGVGMSEEELQKLFRNDAHFSKRGTQNEKGTGLGLMLCKEFVNNHNGKIWVESEISKGSTFFFTLPTGGL